MYPEANHCIFAFATQSALMMTELVCHIMWEYFE